MSIANVTEVLLPKLEASLLYKLSATCRELQTECGKDFLWENLLVRDLLQTHCAEKSCVANASSTTEPSARTKYVKILKPQADTLVCRLCENRLWRRRRPDTISRGPGDQGWALRRCTCLSKRVRIPLCVADLSPARVDDPFESWGGFEDARKALQEAFDLRLVSLDTLTDEGLKDVDLLFCNPTSSHEAISREEQEAMARFHAAGGTSILDLFDLWSNNTDKAQALASPLGIHLDQDSRFGIKTYLELPNVQDTKYSREILDGPFGRAKTFCNCGETEFSVPDGQALLSEKLARRLHFFPSLGHDPEDVSALYCPGGLGQSLASSNFHWFCSKGYWTGGLWEDGDNRKLFLNLAASAARVLLTDFSSTQSEECSQGLLANTPGSSES